MAKIVACEAHNQASDEALQIHGGYGYMMEFPVQRYWQDDGRRNDGCDEGNYHQKDY